MTGPAALNDEIASQWKDYWSDAEKLAVLAKFTMYLLER